MNMRERIADLRYGITNNALTDRFYDLYDNVGRMSVINALGRNDPEELEARANRSEMWACVYAGGLALSVIGYESMNGNGKEAAVVGGLVSVLGLRNSLKRARIYSSAAKNPDLEQVERIKGVKRWRDEELDDTLRTLFADVWGKDEEDEHYKRAIEKTRQRLLEEQQEG